LSGKALPDYIQADARETRPDRLMCCLGLAFCLVLRGSDTRAVQRRATTEWIASQPRMTSKAPTDAKIGNVSFMIS
jgi:hypothetical protein